MQQSLRGHKHHLSCCAANSQTGFMPDSIIWVTAVTMLTWSSNPTNVLLTQHQWFLILIIKLRHDWFGQKGGQLTPSFISTSNIKMAEDTVSEWTWIGPGMIQSWFWYMLSYVWLWGGCPGFMTLKKHLKKKVNSFMLKSIKWHNSSSLRFYMFQLFQDSTLNLILAAILKAILKNGDDSLVKVVFKWKAKCPTRCYLSENGTSKSPTASKQDAGQKWSWMLELLPRLGLWSVWKRLWRRVQK